MLHTTRLLRPWYTVYQTVSVSPSVLQAEQDGNGEADHEPAQAAILVQVHKEQKCESGFDDRHDQHALEHLRRADILIGNHELDGCQYQQKNIDDQILRDSAIFVRLCCSHLILLLPLPA